MPFRRWLPNFLLALLGVAILATFPAVAQNPCTPTETILSRIKENTRLREIRVLSGVKLDKAAHRFNEITQNEIPWPLALLAIRKDGWAMLMVGFEDQLCGFVVFDENGVRLLLKDIDGEAI